MKFKKIISSLSAAALAVTALFTSYSFTDNSVATAADTFTDMDQDSIVAAMGAGWNVGNQLEAASNGTPNETAWGNPVITKDLIQAVKDAGFNTVRVPISYLGYIGDKASGYKIDESWLARIKEVVDYAYDLDMYVIINMHGDGYNTVGGGWLLCNAPDNEQPAIKEKYEACWKQIANKFKDYDEHLIFESMNEEFDGEYHNPVKAYYENINAYNQIFVDTVRQTGSNNAKRWLLIPGWNTDIDYTVGNYGFALPTDTHRDSSITKNRIMVSVHYYAPWDFCGGGTSTSYSQWGKDSDPSKRAPWDADETYMAGQFKKVYDKFVKAGYPVIIGEYGCINKSSNDTENTKFRAYYDKTLCEYAKQYGCVPVYWDNGAVSNSFGLFNRNTKTVVMPEIVEAIVSVFSSAKDNLQRTVDMVSELLEENYTTETWASLKSALTEAQNLLKNSGTDSEYTAAYDKLVKAYTALEKSASYSEEIVIISENDDFESSKENTQADLYIKSVASDTADIGKVNKITLKFTVDREVSDSEKMFNIKPYDDETWSGWDDNFVTISDCTYDEATGEYTAVIEAQGVLATYSGSRANGGNALNLYYVSNDCDIKITYYSIMVTEGHVHNFKISDKKEATCTVDGYEVYVCDDDKAEYNRVLVAGHKYALSDRVDPTETEDGYRRYTCSVCGDTYDEVLPATGIIPTPPPTEPDTMTLSGTINAPGGDDTPVTVTITKEGETEPVYTGTAAGDMTYSAKLEAGAYIVEFSKKNFVSRLYEINLVDKDESMDAEIHLVGDVNGDGEITTADAAQANAHAREVVLLIDYDFAVAEVTGDGKVTTADFGKINAHSNGVSFLW